jgi:hypothetical protein
VIGSRRLMRARRDHDEAGWVVDDDRDGRARRAAHGSWMMIAMAARDALRSATPSLLHRNRWTKHVPGPRCAGRRSEDVGDYQEVARPRGSLAGERRDRRGIQQAAGRAPRRRRRAEWTVTRVCAPHAGRGAEDARSALHGCRGARTFRGSITSPTGRSCQLRTPGR